MRQTTCLVVPAVIVTLGLVWSASCDEDVSTELKPLQMPDAPRKWAPAVKAKHLSENVKKGLAWLVKTQQSNGSWSQGEESAQMGNAMDKVKALPNVADTCMAALALIRSGSTPKSGEYDEAVLKAIVFVCSEIEQADDKTMFITNLRGTRTQAKLGQFIDTFMASMLLAEAREQMADEAGTKRVKAAFHKVMDKIEKNQKPDGTWDGQGWAPVLQQSMAAKGLNRAKQSGEEVSEQVRANLEQFAQHQFETKNGKVALAAVAEPPPAPGTISEADARGSFGARFGTGRAASVSGAGGSAGVDLYAWAANISALRDQDNTNAVEMPRLKERLAKSNDESEKTEIQATLDRYDRNRKALEEVQGTLVQNLENDRFVKGFGSNGGEEFLSYMNIGESLVVSGGEAWTQWDKKMVENLNRIQNEDGSWTGHHCITGRSFCTSAALLVLTVDRAPVPVAAEIRRR